jgi:ATP-dependent Clp protease ATP-binding subunit ClpC
MFEKYTEKARRSVFFARYEASTFGSRQIEIEHLLLGILRENHQLALRLLKSPQQVDSIREKIEQRYPKGETVSTSVDLPVSADCKRAFNKAHKESKRRHQKHIGPEHLLLGIYLEEASLAAKILRESGVTFEDLSGEAGRSTPLGTKSAAAPAQPPESETAETLRGLVEKAAEAAEAARWRPSVSASEPSPPVIRNLSEAAREGKLSPLIGRERELARIMQILSRRTRNNPILVGEPGVGKTAILEGVAQRIADCSVPKVLADRPIFAIDASTLVAPSRRVRSGEAPERLLSLLTAQPIGILCVDGLLDLAASPGWGAIEATHVLEVLSRSGIQCMATGTPAGLRRAIENAGVLVRHFEVVEIAPPTEEEAVRILAGLKPQYEKFHGVIFGDAVIEAAVFASGRFLPHRYLPDRALDLIDDAGARARVRREGEPRDEVETQQRIRRAVRDMENAIAKHEFDKAKEYAEQERREREKLRRLQAERTPAEPPANTITTADLEEAIAERAGVPVSAVQAILRQKKGKELQAVAQKLAAAVTADQQGWLPFLAAYLAGCPAEDAERLAQAIRDAKKA